MKTKCYIAEHRATLDESLKTQKPIPYDTFWRLINSGLYYYYAFDDRIKAYRYIIKDMGKNYNMPAWLNYYGIRKPI